MMLRQIFVVTLLAFIVVIASVIGQEEEFDDVIDFAESENSSSNDIFKCLALFQTCDEILDKYYTEGNHKESLTIRRNTPLETQCRDGRQFITCYKNISSDSNCESTFKSMDISGRQEENEKLFKFICVDEFNAFNDHLSCILSDAVLDNYEICLDQHFRYRNCSGGTELYKCLKPAIDRSPACTSKGKLLFRKAANKLVAIYPACDRTDKNRDDEKEEEDSDEIEQDKDSGEKFEKEVDKNGVHIKLQLEVNFPKDKKEKKTRNILPWF